MTQRGLTPSSAGSYNACEARRYAPPSRAQSSEQAETIALTDANVPSALRYAACRSRFSSSHVTSAHHHGVPRYAFGSRYEPNRKSRYAGSSSSSHSSSSSSGHGSSHSSSDRSSNGDG